MDGFNKRRDQRLDLAIIILRPLQRGNSVVQVATDLLVGGQEPGGVPVPDHVGEHVVGAPRHRILRQPHRIAHELPTGVAGVVGHRLVHAIPALAALQLTYVHPDEPRFFVDKYRGAVGGHEHRALVGAGIARLPRQRLLLLEAEVWRQVVRCTGQRGRGRGPVFEERVQGAKFADHLRGEVATVESGGLAGE
jgi:hypothetical protein